MGVKTRNLSNTVGLDIEWQGVQTGNFTAVAGRGYFVDTTNNTITVTLPSSPSQGDTVVLKDYARTWNTNAVSTSSANYDGVTKTNSFNTQGQTVTLVYMDGTKGWSLINEDTTTDLSAQFTQATGGTITTSGDYKIHTFTGDGCFVVSAVGNGPTVPLGGPNTVSYLVVAGGGAAGGTAPNGNANAGGGAGGFREGRDIGPSYTASPLVAPSGLTISATSFPITVGAGGTGGASSSPKAGTNGANSVFSTITSAGGGAGGHDDTRLGIAGGSGGGTGGGACNSGCRASGNTPPVSPPQGNPGGSSPIGPPDTGSGGGGGATAAGADSAGVGGNGGAGATTSITGSPTAYAGGGGGGAGTPQNTAGTGGTGGGGNGGIKCGPNGVAGTSNTGGGGGGTGANDGLTGANGGSGIVVIRYKFQ